jgi:hypothetical protein
MRMLCRINKLRDEHLAPHAKFATMSANSFKRVQRVSRHVRLATRRAGHDGHTFNQERILATPETSPHSSRACRLLSAEIAFDGDHAAIYPFKT